MEIKGYQPVSARGGSETRSTHKHDCCVEMNAARVRLSEGELLPREKNQVSQGLFGREGQME